MQISDFAVKMLPLDSLVAYEHNSKIHTRENIDATKASIERFGFRDPLSVWKNPSGGGVLHCRGAWQEAGA